MYICLSYTNCCCILNFLKIISTVTENKFSQIELPVTNSQLAINDADSGDDGTRIFYGNWPKAFCAAHMYDLADEQTLYR